MPINAFGGGPGSGKTYGVMEHVILPAIAKGRFVITNIDGLNEEAIYQYVVDNAPVGKIICIGHIRHCGRDDPERADFFPGVEALDKAMPCPSPDLKNVSGGDLVVIDEATRYWAAGDKVKKEHAYFFREHRHFANDVGHTCDLVVIDPDLSMLVRALKGKIEMASITYKPKELGLNRYVVKLYRGVKLSVPPTSTLGPLPFRPEIYALYRSYAVAGAKEQSIDGRQSVLRKMVLSLVGLLALLCCCGWLFWYIYKSKVDSLTEKPKAAGSAAAAPGSPVGPAVAGELPPSSRSAVGSGVSPTMRVAGEMTINGQRWVVVADGMAVRVENPAAFVGRGVMMVGDIQGQRVTTWSGVPAGADRGEVFKK